MTPPQLALALLLAGGSLLAQDPKQPPAPVEMLALAKPGAEHEKLAQYVGKWDIEVRIGLGAKAAVYQGTAENSMKVGGRFLQMQFQAKGAADSTEGLFTLGFDSRHKRHTLIAMDSFGNYFVTSQGQQDAATGKIRMLGTDDDPVMKSMGHAKEFVHVLDLRSPDEFALEVWFVDTRTPARREFKFMDYVFKRKG